MSKIISVSAIEALQRYTIDHRGLPFIEQDGNWIAHNDLRALLDTVPSVSGEAELGKYIIEAKDNHEKQD